MKYIAGRGVHAGGSCSAGTICNISEKWVVNEIFYYFNAVTIKKKLQNNCNSLLAIGN